MKHYYNSFGERISKQKQEAIKAIMEYWTAHVIYDDDIVIVDPEADYETLINNGKDVLKVSKVIAIANQKGGVGKTTTTV